MQLIFTPPPPCTWDGGITIDIFLCKAWIYALHYGDILKVKSLVTVSAHLHMPRSTSVLVGSKPDISKALPTLTRVPICHCYHRSHGCITQIRIVHIQNLYLVRTASVAIVTENIFLIKCIDLFFNYFLGYRRICSCTVGGQTDIQTDRERDRGLTL